MYVGVVHTIKDRNAWTQMVENFDPAALPEGIELLATGTSGDVDRAVCLWRAPSVETLETTLTQSFGDISVNDCFGVLPESVIVAGSRPEAAGV
jgi:hypothetical protein